MMAHKATHGWTAPKDDDDGAPHAVETQPTSEATTLTSPTPGAAGPAKKTTEPLLRHHDENVPCCFPQGHGACQGIASLGDIHPVPLPYVRVEVNGKTMEFDTLKLNPSSALSEGSGGAAKVFNRLLKHTTSEEIVDAMSGAFTNSSIVMALILTISIPGERPQPGEDSIWGDPGSERVNTVLDVLDMVVGMTATVCVSGLVLSVGLLTQLSRIPKASVPVYMVKMGPGKTQAPDLLWRLACLLFLLHIFLKLSIITTAWVTYAWIVVSVGLTIFVFNTIYHGQFCVNETVHVMANSDAYLWDANAPAAYESGLCWGCKNDADRGVSPAQYNM